MGLVIEWLIDMFDYLENIRSKQFLSPTKKAIDKICVPLSDDGEGEEAVYEVFKHSILPYSLIITSPSPLTRFTLPVLTAGRTGRPDIPALLPGLTT